LSANMAETLRKEAEMKAKALKKTGEIPVKIMILSGKGGVGKSITTANLALAFSKLGYRGKVAILDGDIHGPSIPMYLGIDNKHLGAEGDKIFPVEGPMGIKVVSASYFLPKQELPIIWRGPLKVKFIRDMLASVEWGETRILLIDTPPGTGDEIQGITQYVNRMSGAVVVTAPSDASLNVVKRAITFLKIVKVPLLGIIENFSYVRCPSGEEKRIMGDGGRKVEEALGGKIIASIPYDPLLANPITEIGNPYEVEDLRGDPAARAFISAAKMILEEMNGGKID
ncbi:MAG: P-loop NTPase, partial [Desulfurococcales archaeon]